MDTIPNPRFIIPRMSGSLEPWIEKTWRPGEIEMVNQ
jgi:hypothetical protein